MADVTATVRRVDTFAAPSLSFRPPVPVGPGRSILEPGAASRPDEGTVNDFPISRAKVTPPPVREETLARERLLGWLDSAVLRRVVYVVAEAGYGKTTLLADFDRRSRVRCLWYKLDEPDRDWLTFMHYLVAAAREAVPDFGASTAALLREASSGEPVRDAAVATLASELEQLAQPTVLILDDYHLVDDAPEIDRLVHRLVRTAPERLCFAFLTRRRPTLRLGRLHALDEVREIGRDELRFSREETARLFSEAYRQPLEPDIIDELEARTEGWAASLQLVRSGIQGRSAAEVRAFVRRLSGAEGRLYDYLAEEVIGELPPPTRRFLTRTAILERVTPELARAVLGVGAERPPTLHEMRALIQRCEELGLLSRRGESSRWSHRYHPLTRDFLLRRLDDELEPGSVRESHRAVAREAEPGSWSVAARHWLQAGEPAEAVATIERQIAAIAASGEYSLAADYLARAGLDSRSEVAAIVEARVDLYAGRGDRVRERLHAALRSPISPSPTALQLLMSIATSLGDMTAAAAMAEILLKTDDLPEWQRLIAQATISMRDVALTGQLAPALAVMEEAATLHERERRWHLAAISRFNVAELDRISGQYRSAIANAQRSVDHFLRSGGDAAELGSAHALIGAAHAELDEFSESLYAFNQAQKHSKAAAYEFELILLQAEALVDMGRHEEGSAQADQAFDGLGAGAMESALALAATTGADIATKCWEFNIAHQRLKLHDASRPSTEFAGLAHQTLTSSRLALLTGDASAWDLARAAAELAGRQGAKHVQARAEILVAAAQGSAAGLADAIARAALIGPGALRSEAAAITSVIHLLHDLPPSLLASMERCPEAWRPHLRASLENPDRRLRLAAGRLLDRFGEYADVPRLRALARAPGTARGDRELGKGLARRTAPRVFIHDLGRMVIQVGERHIEATGIRRKVAALLGYLLTRPEFTATREQVLEALWPDAPPEVGMNSLHQTIYFLRRELEPAYADQTSPGYVRLEGELLWLDPELVDCASHRFARSAALARADAEPADALATIELYRGRFAPEFEYEEWAIATRDGLHAAYLEVIERILRGHVATGRWNEGAEVARRALAVDPLAESIERNLIALYHFAGSHAAASEQYAHYAASMRAEYGVEPPSLESIVGGAAR